MKRDVSQKKIIGMLFLQALIWAAFHRQYWDNPIQLILVFLLGAYLEVYYIFSQDIRKPIVIHCLINLVGLLDFYSKNT
ncbi:CPBP family glutamic-type intramembrane protease [Candidatus Lokiarchaeum ossiferum]|uniref:CPBP family glutamic-type intramembrane protease n=1 Tax=Candidatus Lokiarchaeum ossiferum TaxID=2951803 RepID=UPI00352E67AD